MSADKRRFGNHSFTMAISKGHDFSNFPGREFKYLDFEECDEHVDAIGKLRCGLGEFRDYSKTVAPVTVPGCTEHTWKCRGEGCDGHMTVVESEDTDGLMVQHSSPCGCDLFSQPFETREQMFKQRFDCLAELRRQMVCFLFLQHKLVVVRVANSDPDAQVQAEIPSGVSLRLANGKWIRVGFSLKSCRQRTDKCHFRAEVKYWQITSFPRDLEKAARSELTARTCVQCNAEDLVDATVMYRLVCACPPKNNTYCGSCIANLFGSRSDCPDDTANGFIKLEHTAEQLECPNMSEHKVTHVQLVDSGGRTLPATRIAFPYVWMYGRPLFNGDGNYYKDTEAVFNKAVKPIWKARFDAKGHIRLFSALRSSLHSDTPPHIMAVMDEKIKELQVHLEEKIPPIPKWATGDLNEPIPNLEDVTVPVIPPEPGYVPSSVPGTGTEVINVD